MINKQNGYLSTLNTLWSELTLKSPGCRYDLISFLCFLLEDVEDEGLLPFVLIEVKSSLQNLYFDASEKGELGDWSIFSFLFIGVAKLQMEITIMDSQNTQNEEHIFLYYDHYSFPVTSCWTWLIILLFWKQVLT